MGKEASLKAFCQRELNHEEIISLAVFAILYHLVPKLKPQERRMLIIADERLAKEAKKVGLLWD